MTRTVLVTGASQGTGKATALLFARQGYDVVLVARHQDRLHAVADEIKAMQRSSLVVPTDVTQPEQVAAMAEQALDHFDTIDVLVNSAGVCLTGAIEHTTLTDWHRIVDTNFWGCVHTIQALLPHFLKCQSGTIVNVGSFGGKMPLPLMAAYSASKYAVTGLTESLRIELAPKGIHVCAVHPGMINSSFLERATFRAETPQDAEQLRQQMASLLNHGWVSQPEEVAQTIWQMVENRKAEVVVGPAAIATECYRLMPGLVQWAMTQTLSENRTT